MKKARDDALLVAVLVVAVLLFGWLLLMSAPTSA